MCILYYTYEDDGVFVESLSNMSDVVSLSNVFRSTDLGSSICDVPKI
jgi:hypothetical protein